MVLQRARSENEDSTALSSAMVCQSSRMVCPALRGARRWLAAIARPAVTIRRSSSPSRWVEFPTSDGLREDAEMNIESPAPSNHCHVALRAGFASSGKPVFETLPARAIGPSCYELTGSPGMVEGCAAGDLLRIDADGVFQVERRGPNLCIQAFGEPPFDVESLESLISAFVPLGGLVEAPADRQFIVVTVPAAAGFPAVEAVMEMWAAGVSVPVEWGFSNVFGPDGEPLNWWQASEA